jgi:hypothetical protein
VEKSVEVLVDQLVWVALVAPSRREPLEILPHSTPARLHLAEPFRLSFQPLPPGPAQAMTVSMSQWPRTWAMPVIMVPFKLAAIRAELVACVQSHDAHRPHPSFRGRMPAEV